MGAMSELTLGEVGRGLARYRPVALTVGAILLAIAVMPKPDVDLVGSAEPIPGASTSEIATTDTVVSAPTTEPVAFDDSSSTFVPSAPSAGSTTFTPSSPSPTFAPPAADDSPPAFSPSTPTAEGGFTFAPTTSSDQPLRIVAKAWASRTAGTPLAAEGVPPGSLPVGTRANTDDKLSFIRLSGDETTLRLSEVTTGARATVQGPVKVMACQITVSGWKEAEAMAITAGPADDVNKCVEGVRSPEGVWLFDLASFPTRTDDRGFSLRPAKGAGVDFQVAFKP